MDTSPTSPYGSVHHDRTSAEPSHINLAHISHTNGPAMTTGLDRQHVSPVDTLSEQAESGAHGHVASNQGFCQPVDTFDLSVIDTGRSPIQSSSNHCQMSTYYPQSSPGLLLQVPPTQPMKRSRTSGKYHSQGSRNMGKKRKLPTHIHHGSPENSTEALSHIPQDQVQAIREVARNCSGTSEDALSLKTQVLSIVESIYEPDKTPDRSPELDPDNTKKPIECDTCHKKVARPCDLKYRISLDAWSLPTNHIQEAHKTPYSPLWLYLCRLL